MDMNPGLAEWLVPASSSCWLPCLLPPATACFFSFPKLDPRAGAIPGSPPSWDPGGILSFLWLRLQNAQCQLPPRHSDHLLLELDSLCWSLLGSPQLLSRFSSQEKDFVFSAC